MNILITGGSGFIGSHLAERLSNKHTIFILDSHTPPISAELYKKFYKTDIRNLAGIKKICKSDIDTIVHLAAKSTPRDMSNVNEFYDLNVKGTLNVLEAARICDVKKFVFASSSHVYGSTKTPQREDMACFPNSFYGASKLACEHLCTLYGRLYGIEMSIPRFFTVYGPRGRKDMAVLRFIENIYNGSPITVYGQGKERKDFIHVMDVTTSIEKMLRSKGTGIINIGTGRSADLDYIIRLIEVELNKKANIKYLEHQKWDADTEADITRAKRLLKWEPKISIEDGIEDTVSWFTLQTK